MSADNPTPKHPLIRVEFTVREHHAVFFTPEEFAEWVGRVLPDADPTDLDEVYNMLDIGGWQIEEELEELRTRHSWFETDDAQIREVEHDSAEVAAAEAVSS